MYELMNGIGYYGFGNYVLIFVWIFLIDILVLFVVKGKIYVLFVVRLMSIISN